MVEIVTPDEQRQIEQYRAGQEERGPRLKVTRNNEGKVKIAADHPSATVGMLEIMRTIGAADQDFYKGLISQIVHVAEHKEADANYMLAMIKGIGPRDTVEAMLASQMSVIHNETLELARRLSKSRILAATEVAERGLNRLARTFAAQVEALKRYRSSGEQKMTVPACPRRRGRSGDRRQRDCASPRGGGAKKSRRTTPCPCLCTWRRDAAPNRSGAGYNAARQRCGGLASAGCTGPGRPAKAEPRYHDAGLTDFGHDYGGRACFAPPPPSIGCGGGAEQSNRRKARVEQTKAERRLIVRSRERG